MTLNAAADQTYVATLSEDGADTSLSGSTITITAGNTSGTRTLTNVSTAEVVHVTLVGVSPTLTVVGSPQTVTFSAFSSAADFASRRSGASVVWWQGFDFDAEVTNFQKAQDPYLAPVALYREADATVGNALVFKFLGATLAADFLASGGNGPRSMVLDDASQWPSTFPFNFFVSKLPDTGPDQKTVFKCTARSGNTLTVEYVPMVGASEFESTPTIGIDRFIGDAAGGEAPNYSRPFSALSGADNGRGVDDPAAGGAVPVRSRIVGNAHYVPQTPSLFGYGFIGHSDYHADSRFSPWLPSAQAGQGDSVSRSSIWDGNEAWFQFRMWLSPDTQLTNQVGGKTWSIQAGTTVPHQIVAGIGPGTIYTIPGTPDTVPFSLAKFSYASYGSAGLAMAADAYSPNGSSYQPGSFDPVTGKSWAATALYAVSGLPSTGQDTPDGNSAWEYKLGRWITFLGHIKPGKNWHYEVDLLNAWTSASQSSLTLIDAPDDWPTSSFQVQAIQSGSLVGTFDVATRSGKVLSGVTLASGSHGTFGTSDTSIRKIPATPAGTDALSTELEVFVADIDQAQYVQLAHFTNYPINFGSNGQYTNRWYDSVPGFSALEFWGYHNSELSVASAPRKTYFQKFAQPIFSRAYIPPPKPAWMGFSLPASGSIGALGSHTLYDIVSDTNERFSLSKVISAWGSSALVRIRDGNGLLTDLMYVIFGGGHGDTGNDGVYGWRFSTGQFERILSPSTQVVARLYAPAACDTTYGEEVGGTVGRPASAHQYQSRQALDSGEGMGPGMLVIRGLASGSGAIVTGQSHFLDLDTNTFARYAALQPFNASGGWVVVVKDKKRKLFRAFEVDNGTRFLELDYTSLSPSWVERNQSARTTNGWGGNNIPAGVHDPKRDIYIAGNHGMGAGLMGLDAATPTGAWVALNVTGSGPTGTASFNANMKWWYRGKTDTFITIDHGTFPPTGVYVLTPPATGTWSSGTWTFSRQAFSGSSQHANDPGSWETYERYQYVEELDAFIGCPRKDAPMECWAL